VCPISELNVSGCPCSSSPPDTLLLLHHHPAPCTQTRLLHRIGWWIRLLRRLSRRRPPVAARLVNDALKLQLPRSMPSTHSCPVNVPLAAPGRPPWLSILRLITSVSQGQMEDKVLLTKKRFFCRFCLNFRLLLTVEGLLFPIVFLANLFLKLTH
jgi:hypothetical protein